MSKAAQFIDEGGVMAQTKDERAAYHREWRARNAERLHEQRAARYAEHAEEERAQVSAAYADRREQRADTYAESRRIERYLIRGRLAGLTEEECWWFAMQCEVERAREGSSALYGGKLASLIAAILDARPANAKLDARQWEAPVGDRAGLEDDGWDGEEGAA